LIHHLKLFAYFEYFAGNSRGNYDDTFEGVQDKNSCALIQLIKELLLPSEWVKKLFFPHKSLAEHRF
jgi:hypothetical protein